MIQYIVIWHLCYWSEVVFPMLIKFHSMKWNIWTHSIVIKTTFHRLLSAHFWCLDAICNSILVPLHNTLCYFSDSHIQSSSDLRLSSPIGQKPSNLTGSVIYAYVSHTRRHLQRCFGIMPWCLTAVLGGLLFQLIVVHLASIKDSSSNFTYY